jgi:CDP-diacylglycerol---serine O-phosphatidyltransferase
MSGLFPALDPESRRNGRRRRRAVPLRAMLPNMVTLLALGAGLTAIRMALEGRFELATGAIIFAAILDGIDGRVARLLKSSSKFGEQLDSLADFVNFGVAPAILLYVWSLQELGSLGWIAALVLAICAGLRLARFNAALDGEPPPEWQKDFFIGVPSPAGALVALLPLALFKVGVPVPPQAAALVALYAVAMGLLMVSTLPTFSGKSFGARIPGEAVLPVFLLAVLFFALLVSYTFVVMAVGSILYLAHLPFAWRAWQRQAGKARAEAAERAASEASPGE